MAITGGSPSPNVGGPATYVLATPLSSYINNDESIVNVDSSPFPLSPATEVPFTLTDYVSGGTTPYTYEWSNPGTTAPSSCTGLPGSTLDSAYSGVHLNSTQNALNMGYGSPSYTTSIATNSHTTVTYYAEVEVTDSTSPGAPSSACEAVTINVEPVFTPSFTIDGSSTPITGQVGSPALQAVVLIVGGSPWYAVTIYSGTDSVCSNDKTVVASQNDINASEAILTFPEPSTPSSITYYCAVVSDITGNTVVLGPVQVDITPALSTPTLTIMPTSVDYGNPTALPYVTAMVSWAGGNAPYFVVLTSGSQSSCAAPDNVAEYPLASTITGPLVSSTNTLAEEYITLGYAVYTTTGIAATFELPVPSSTTYYCAIVFDSSQPASQTYTPAGAEFLIEGLFAVNPPVLASYSTEVLTPEYEGTPDTATVTWSGGTGPYSVELYNAASPGTCSFLDTPVMVSPGSNPLTGVTGDSASFTFLVPNAAGTYYYCAIVVDSTGNVVFSTTSLPLVVATTLGTVTAKWATWISATSVAGIDVGQTEQATLYATWSSSTGTPPYTATLYSGSSSSCSMDKTTVTVLSNETNPQTVSGGSATFKFASPTSPTTYYCVVVTDSSAPTSVSPSNVLTWSNNAPPGVSLPMGYEIEAGTMTSIPATITSAGTAPDFLQWFIGAGCAAGSAVTAAPPGTTNPYHTGIITSTTTYSVQITDSSPGLPAETACASITITVNQGPQSVAAESTGPFAGLVFVTNTSPGVPQISVIDTDSNSVVATITAPSFLAGYIAWGVAVTSSSTPSLNLVLFTLTNPASPYDSYLCSYYIATLSEANCLTTYGNQAEGVAWDAALGEAFVANSANNQVGVFTDTALPIAFPGGLGAGMNLINVGPAPMNVAVDQNTHTVYVTDFGGNTVSVLQPRLNGGFAVTTVTVGFEPTGVAVDPATDNVWVTNFGSGTVSVLNGFTYNVIQTIKVGGNPTGIAISDANNEALVANAATNTVTPISLTTFAPGTPIAVGSVPFGLADFLSGVAGIPSLAFVANSGSNTVSVIDLATGAVIATIVVP